MDPFSIIVFMMIMVIVSIYVSNTDFNIAVDIKNIRSKLNIEKDFEYKNLEKNIQKLNSKIKILEDINNLYYSTRSKIFNNDYFQSQFDKCITPSILLDDENIIENINDAFIKNYELYKIKKSLIGTNIINISYIFGQNGKNLLEAIEYVKETKQNITIEIIEKGLNSAPTAHKIFISNHSDEKFMLLQFSSFILTTVERKIITDDKYIYKNNKPIIITDEYLNILDRNISAIEFFNGFDMENSTKKIFQIFPSVKSTSVVEYLSKLDKVKLKVIGQGISCYVTIDKAELNDNDIFIFTVVG